MKKERIIIYVGNAWGGWLVGEDAGTAQMGGLHVELAGKGVDDDGHYGIRAGAGAKQVVEGEQAVVGQVVGERPDGREGVCASQIGGCGDLIGDQLLVEFDDRGLDIVEVAHRVISVGRSGQVSDADFSR